MVSMQEDLEKNVTSAAIQGAQDISEFISLPVECFTTEVFRNIHSSVREMVLEGHDVSPVSVYEKMESTSTPLTLDAIFGLTNDYVLLDTQFAGLCKRLRSACDKRMVYNAVLEAAELAKDAQDAVEAKQTAIGRLLSIDDYGPRNHIFTLNDSLKSVIGSARDAFERPLEEKTKPVGVTTGIKSLDEILGGFHAGDLYILGAKTGRGKTVLGLNVAVAAAKSGKKVLYFSLEMKHEKISLRVLSAEASVCGKLIETGFITSEQIDGLLSASTTLSKIGENLTIIDQRGVNLYQLGATVRQVSKQSGVDLVVVDYLQLLEVDETYSREREVASISKALVAVAGINDVPVLALSQLNETGQIRESRAVGQDAAGILRIDYTDEVDSNWDKNSEPVDATIRVLKHRHGDCGNVSVTFNRAHQFFAENVPYSGYGG